VLARWSLFGVFTVIAASVTDRKQIKKLATTQTEHEQGLSTSRNQ
jgi:hypothetical protein